LDFVFVDYKDFKDLDHQKAFVRTYGAIVIYNAPRNAYCFSVVSESDGTIEVFRLNWHEAILLIEHSAFNQTRDKGAIIKDMCIARLTGSSISVWEARRRLGLAE
jgi:hypothetical protein